MSCESHPSLTAAEISSGHPALLWEPSVTLVISAVLIFLFFAFKSSYFLYSYFISVLVVASFSLGSWYCKTSTNEKDHVGTMQGRKEVHKKKG